MKQHKILESDKDAAKIFDEAKLFTTEKKMFRTRFVFNVQADSSPLKLHFRHLLSENIIKLTSGEGDMQFVSKESFMDGMRNFIIDAGKNIKIELIDPPQLH